MITNFCKKYDVNHMMMILGQQPLPETERLHDLDNVIQSNALNSDGIAIIELLRSIALDAYSLGRMNGIREERSRRKNKRP